MNGEERERDKTIPGMRMRRGNIMHGLLALHKSVLVHANARRSDYQDARVFCISRLPKIPGYSASSNSLLLRDMNGKLKLPSVILSDRHLDANIKFFQDSIT